MNRKIIYVCSISLITGTLFFGIKWKNFLIGQKILGEYTSLSSENLNIKPVRRNIKPARAATCLRSSMGNIKLKIPKTDTFRVFKYNNELSSFKFNDSSQLKILKDTFQMDFLKILTSNAPTNINVISNYIKANKISSNFDLLLMAYNKTPGDISFFNLSEENTIIQYSLLKLKDLAAGPRTEDAFYYFILRNLKGFQYGSPLPPGSAIVKIFTAKGDSYLLTFSGFKQKEVDYVITSIDDSLN